MIVPHKPCPWCGTVEHLSAGVFIGALNDERWCVSCDVCGCIGPIGEWASNKDECERFAWAKWDEFGNGNQWQDYEVKE